MEGDGSVQRFADGCIANVLHLRSPQPGVSADIDITCVGSDGGPSPVRLHCAAKGGCSPQVGTMTSQEVDYSTSTARYTATDATIVFTAIGYQAATSYGGFIDGSYVASFKDGFDATALSIHGSFHACRSDAAPPM